MHKLVVFCVLLLGFNSTFAEEELQSQTKLKTTTEDLTSDHRFLVGANASAQILEGAKGGISFGYRLFPNFILGVTGYYSRDNHDKYSGDSTAINQQVDESNTVSSYDMSQALEINSTLYFRKNGFNRWGPLMTLGIGHNRSSYRNNTLTAGTIETDDDSTYFSLGGYFQFALGFKSQRSVGHLIQVGPKITFNDTRWSDYRIRFSSSEFDFSIPIGLEARYAITF